ncbi:MAG: hypothetical protein WAV09_03595 [Minisyncoccia bacterium]
MSDQCNCAKDFDIKGMHYANCPTLDGIRTAEKDFDEFINEQNKDEIHI